MCSSFFTSSFSLELSFQEEILIPKVLEIVIRDQPGVQMGQEYFIWELAGYAVKTINSLFCFMKILLNKKREGTELHTLKCMGGDILSECLVCWR